MRRVSGRRDPDKEVDEDLGETSRRAEGSGQRGGLGTGTVRPSVETELLRPLPQWDTQTPAGPWPRGGRVSTGRAEGPRSEGHTDYRPSEPSRFRSVGSTTRDTNHGWHPSGVVGE